MRYIFLVFILVAIDSITYSQTSEVKQIVIDLNPQNFNADFGEYDQATSMYCAELSDIVYLNEVEIMTIVSALQIAYPNAGYQFEFIEEKSKKTDTQVLLFGSNKFMIVAFRGTEINKKRDIFIDLKHWTYVNTPNGEKQYKGLHPGHAGFRRSVMNLIDYKDIFSRIDSFVSNCGGNKSSFPIYLTGHSLGSAIAQMFVTPLVNSGFQFSGMYNFAPPLAVRRDSSILLNCRYGDITYDIVNYKDFIPRASFKSRVRLEHFGKFYRICKNGNIFKEEEKYVKFNLGEYRDEFKLHAIQSYIEAIRMEANNVLDINNRSLDGKDCLGKTK